MLSFKFLFKNWRETEVNDFFCEEWHNFITSCWFSLSSNSGMWLPLTALVCSNENYIIRRSIAHVLFFFLIGFWTPQVVPPVTSLVVMLTPHLSNREDDRWGWNSSSRNLRDSRMVTDNMILNKLKQRWPHITLTRKTSLKEKVSVCWLLDKCFLLRCSQWETNKCYICQNLSVFAYVHPRFHVTTMSRSPTGVWHYWKIDR